MKPHHASFSQLLLLNDTRQFFVRFSYSVRF